MGRDRATVVIRGNSEGDKRGTPPAPAALGGWMFTLGTKEFHSCLFWANFCDVLQVCSVLGQISLTTFIIRYSLFF